MYRILSSKLQDTTDFLKKQDANDPLPPETLLVLVDEILLHRYPHEDGIKACEEVLERSSDTNSD